LAKKALQSMVNATAVFGPDVDYKADKEENKNF
jgi:hypothetical protein